MHLSLVAALAAPVQSFVVDGNDLGVLQHYRRERLQLDHLTPRLCHRNHIVRRFPLGGTCSVRKQHDGKLRLSCDCFKLCHRCADLGSLYTLRLLLDLVDALEEHLPTVRTELSVMSRMFELCESVTEQAVKNSIG